MKWIGAEHSSGATTAWTTAHQAASRLQDASAALLYAHFLPLPAKKEPIVRCPAGGSLAALAACLPPAVLPRPLLRCCCCCLPAAELPLPPADAVAAASELDRRAFFRCEPSTSTCCCSCCCSCCCLSAGATSPAGPAAAAVAAPAALPSPPLASAAAAAAAAGRFLLAAPNMESSERWEVSLKRRCSSRQAWQGGCGASGCRSFSSSRMPGRVCDGEGALMWRS